jgi:hypothetical protein
MPITGFEIDGLLKVEPIPGGNLMLTIPDKGFVVLTPDEWKRVVSATTSIWAHTEMVSPAVKLGWSDLKSRRRR